MNRTRVAFLVVAVCSLLGPRLARGDGPPFTPDKEFSADQVITMKSGVSVASKFYLDNGKARAEMQMQGMQAISIMRPDQKKLYTVMPAQKMVMVMNLDDKMTAEISAAAGDEGKFETIGPDAVDGVACTKYKMTTKDNKVFFWWVNMATKTPLKMAADDGSFTVSWKNYKAGPQDPALFEPPADYQIMQMPGGAGGALPGAE
jgi:hypothetical protein